jgi:hypothetical protein
MASPAQISNNRENARHSTGPVTPEGKARVAQNALKHGLTATHLVVRDDEREEFEELKASLEAELSPHGSIETLTFRELLHAAWNLHRFRRLEAEMSMGSMDDFTNPETAATLDRLTRYQSRAERSYYRALRELRILQTNRMLREVKLDPRAAPRVPAIVDINQLTKQTRSEVTKQAVDLALQITDLEVTNRRLHGVINKQGEMFTDAR